MSVESSSAIDQAMAGICETCPICRHARTTQSGLAFSFVKQVEGAICPFCKAYERVHGKKAHENRVKPRKSS